MPDRIKTKPLEETGPLKRFKIWANGLLADVRRTHIATVAGGGLNESTGGTGLSFNPINVGEEKVTGAVNGVPSTLNVKTDGQGWKTV